jgi:hypothetical protein
MGSQVVLVVLTLELSDSTVVMLPILTENNVQYGSVTNTSYTPAPVTHQHQLHTITTQVATSRGKEIGY